MGLHPKLQWLDNEASLALQDFMVTKAAAECAICTFKNHFIAGLAAWTSSSPSTFGIASSHRLN